MQFSRTGRKYFYSSLILIGSFCLLFSCEGLFDTPGKENPLARVGDAYLFLSDIEPLLANSKSKEDSISFVNNYINNWASNQLLLAKAKINLPESKLAEFERLVANYRNDLYTRAYKEALVQAGSDSVVTKSQMEAFYELEKENFRLKEKLVQLRFVELPILFLNKEEVIKRLKRFGDDDRMYLDSIGVQFKKLNFNDSLWIKASRVIDEIPPLTLENQDRYLKKSQFFELEDAKGVYLTAVIDVLEPNDIAPLTYIEPTIKQVLLSRRKLEYIRKLDAEIIDEAIKDKHFEVYGKEN